jgi:glycosidase
MGHGRLVRIALGAVLAFGGLAGIGCSGGPADYDYHGAPPDIPGVEVPGAADAAELPGAQDVSRDNDVRPGDGTGTDVPSGEERSQDLASDTTVGPGETRDCLQVLEFVPPDGGTPFLAAEFTGWADGELPMEDGDGDGVYSIQLDLSTLSSGSHGYKFHTSLDGWFLDPANPTSKWVEGVENSKLRVPDCRLPELVLDSVTVDAAMGSVSAVVRVLGGVGSVGVNPASAKVRVNGKPIEGDVFDAEKGRFEVSLSGQKPGSKVGMLFSVANEIGNAVPLYLPVWLEQEPFEWRDAVIYFAFTDRFANGNPANDAVEGCAPKDGPTNWHNGDFDGIRQKIESGYFEQLGINVLWISPVIDNPGGCFGGQVPGIAYTAYHGYFPVDIEGTEEHFGTMDELRALVDAAHDRGMRVLFDFVANHVHESSPLFQQHEADGWFHPFHPCEPAWDKPVECWFQPYLPDLDYTNDQVVELTAENALYWIRETGVDGFRVDAVKHMVHNFIRSVRQRVEQGIVTTHAPFYMVGETFMGEWGNGTGMAETVIKEYVNGWELDGQFDFPFYWKVLRAVGRDEGDFAELAAMLEVSLDFWGPAALMVSFIGNHDVPRFASHAAGQIADLWGNGSKEQGFSAPPEQPDDADPYLRLRLAMGLCLTLPEIPMFYYGDEVGLAGAGDPDNRRDMQFGGLSAHQAGTLDFLRKAGKLRRDLTPLRRGDFDILLATPDHFVFTRSYGGQTVLVAANRASGPAALQVPVPVPDGSVLEDLLSGTEASVSGGKASLSISGRGIAVFVLE